MRQRRPSERRVLGPSPLRPAERLVAHNACSPRAGIRFSRWRPGDQEQTYLRLRAKRHGTPGALLKAARRLRLPAGRRPESEAVPGAWRPRGPSQRRQTGGLACAMGDTRDASHATPREESRPGSRRPGAHGRLSRTSAAPRRPDRWCPSAGTLPGPGPRCAECDRERHTHRNVTVS